jgi:hypothetical protein
VPNRDVGSFHISTQAGHEFVEMTVMFPNTDSPFTWAVLGGTVTGGTPSFTFQFNDATRPVAVSATASDNYQTISILATCSTVAIAP